MKNFLNLWKKYVPMWHWMSYKLAWCFQIHEKIRNIWCIGDTAVEAARLKECAKMVQFVDYHLLKLNLSGKNYTMVLITCSFELKKFFDISVDILTFPNSKTEQFTFWKTLVTLYLNLVAMKLTSWKTQTAIHFVVFAFSTSSVFITGWSSH